MPRQTSLWPAFAFLLLLPASQLAAQEIYADWLTATGSDGTFDLGGTSGTVTITNEMNGAGNITAILPIDGTANYPATWFSPTAPPVGTEWASGGVGNVDGANPGSADWVISFDQPVQNPRLHLVNLDASTADLGPTTDVDGDPVVVVRESGNPEFEVTGNVANSTVDTPLAGGCEDAVGGNPNGACGTLQLVGIYSSITVTFTDMFPAGGVGDGFQWTISAPAEADLAVVKEASASTIQPGESLIYTVTVTNNSPTVTVPDVVVTDTLPAGVTLVATNGCAEDPNAAPICTLGTVGPSQSVSYTLEVSVDGADPGSSLTNLVDVSSQVTSDPNLTDNFSSVSTQVGTVLNVPTLSPVSILILVIMVLVTAIAVMRRPNGPRR